MITIKIAVSTPTESLYFDAENLAKKLQLPFTTNSFETYDYLLLLTPECLSLKKLKSRANPLTIDFLSPQMQYRLKNISLRNEALARACGLKQGSKVRIVDATGGLLRDSFILAALGFEVTVLERSPIVFALLEDAIKREKNTNSISNRINIIQNDAIFWLKERQLEERPDIIYLDPMFQRRSKTAASRHEMVIFHEIVGDDSDAVTLLNTALDIAKKRVVVKRPRLAEPLQGNKKPFRTLTGKSCRFDIYQ
jgi:16S rRNA (guanine1516-N2)-methyltransferase